MAYDIGPRIGIEGEAEFRRGIQQINSSLRTLDTEMQLVNSQYDQNDRSQEALTARNNVLNRQIAAQRDRLAELQRGLEAATERYGENDQVTQGWRQALNRATADLNNMERELQRSTDELDRFGSEIDETEASSNRFTGTLGKMGGALKSAAGAAAKTAAVSVAAVGAAAVGAAVGLFKLSNDSVKAMNSLQVQTGATDKEMKGFKATADKIYANNYGENFQDIADTMSAIQRNTGLAGDALQKASENALLLRDSFGYEVEETTRSVNSLMKNFGITADRAYELIAIGAQNGADKNGDLLDTLNEYSVQYKSLGFSADSFVETLINGSEKGAFSIDKVGDAIKEFTIRTKDLSDSSKEAFTSLGLDAGKTFGDFAAGGQSAQKAFTTVVSKLSSIKDPLEKNRIGVALFGTQFEDLEAGILDAFTGLDGSVQKTTGILAKMNEIKYNDLGSAFEGLKRQAVASMSGVTTVATGAIANIVKGIQTGDWKSVATSITQGLTGMMKEMIPVLTTTVPAIIQGLIGVITAVVPEMLPVIIDTTLSLLKVLIDTLIASGPQLIDAGITSIMTLVDGIVDALPTIIEAAIKIIMALAESLLKNLPMIIEAAIKIVFALVDGILTLLPKLIEVALKLIIALTKGLIDALPKLIEKIPQIVETIVDILVENLPLIIEAAYEIIIALTKAIIMNLPLIIDAAYKIIGSLASGIIQFMGKLPETFIKIFNLAKKTFSEMNWKQLGIDIVMGIVNGIKSVATKVASSVKDVAGNALTSIKNFLGIKSPSRVMRDEVGKMIGAGIAKGIDDSKKDVSKASKDLAKAAVPDIQLVKNWIDEKKYYNKLSLEDEKEVWKEATKFYKKNTEERKEAEREVYRLKKELEEQSFNNSKKWIEKEKKYNNLSLTEELAAWERVQKRYAKGTKERDEADKEAADIRQNIYNTLKDASEDYQEKVKSVNKKLIADEKNLNEQYKKAVKDRTRSITDFAGIFEKVNRETLNGKDLLDNLKGQVKYIADWSKNLRMLEVQGLDKELLDELRQLGPDAANEIAALTYLTESQLTEYQGLWKEKNKLARKEALKELKGLRTETNQEIYNLRIEAANELAQYTDEFSAIAKSIRAGTEDEFNALTSDMPGIGKNIIQGLITGMTDSSSVLTATIKSLNQDIKKVINESLGIQSPVSFKNQISKIITGMAEKISLSAGLADSSLLSLNGSIETSIKNNPTGTNIVNIVPVNLDGRTITSTTSKVQYGKNKTRSRALGVVPS